MNLKEAIQLLKQPKVRSSRVLKDLGLHPETKKAVQLMKGKFGPYIKYNNQNYSLPSSVSPEDLKWPVVLNLLTSRPKSNKKNRTKKNFKNQKSYKVTKSAESGFKKPKTFKQRKVQ